MIKIIYITENGKILANKIKNILDYYFYDNNIFTTKNLEIEGNEKGFIFIMASGIVLRKYLDQIKINNDKTKDGFVIIIDEFGKNIIPILSNHIGGGNYFSNLIGRELNSIVAITTATDVNNKIGIDELATKYFLEMPNKKDILKINKKVLTEKVDLILPNEWKPIKNIVNTYNVSYHDKNCVVIDDNILLNPKKIAVGIGARKNIKSHIVYWSIKKALYLRDIPLWRVDCFATVDVKKDEKGLIETVKTFNKELFIFNRQDINEVYNYRNDLAKSDFVYKTIGVYGVAEPVSILGVKKISNNINIDINDIELILREFKNTKKHNIPKQSLKIAISMG